MSSTSTYLQNKNYMNYNIMHAQIGIQHETKIRYQSPVWETFLDAKTSV